MPVLLFAILAFAELALLYRASEAWQRGADVLAQSAAIRSHDSDWREGWDMMADQEQDRAGCDEPTVTFLDGTDAGGRVEVSWSCEYGLQLFNGMTFPPATVSSVAVIPEGE